MSNLPLHGPRRQPLRARSGPAARLTRHAALAVRDGRPPEMDHPVKSSAARARCAAALLATAAGCGALVESRLAERNDGPTPANDGSSECVDLFFAGDIEAPSGLVACPAWRLDSATDLYSIRAEPCSGRGLGLSTAIRCATAAGCPDGSSCPPSGLCHEPPECEQDSECGAAEACACASIDTFDRAHAGVVSNNQCVPAECRSDADCNGRPCGLSQLDACGNVDGFYCRTGRDECSRHADCGGVSSVCGYDVDARRWRCRFKEVCAY